MVIVLIKLLTYVIVVNIGTHEKGQRSEVFYFAVDVLIDKEVIISAIYNQK